MSYQLFIEKVPLIFPDEVSKDTVFTKLSEFPNSCGAGKGFGEKIVPETALGLRISPACWIHDEDWWYAKPTWDDFHAANGRLMLNMSMIIVYKSNKFMMVPRMYRPSTYFVFVSTVGAKYFWKLKARQKREFGMWQDSVFPLTAQGLSI
jgi:hypothetical protein